VLLLYTRRTCDPCIELRETLQWALEERVTAGQLVPVVREIDIDTDPDLQQRYGALVPVVALGATELPLVTSGRQLRAFLDATMPRSG
jgi:glutaredoxin